MILRFLDIFAGIGGFRMGMERAGHVCAGYVEIDEHARRSYRAIFNTAGEWTAKDIRLVPDSRIRDLGNIDCICGGFPCQPFSIAGKRAGFEDTRGNLFFEIARFAQILRPPLLFLENVNGLLSHGGGGETFRAILSALDELGYNAEWQVLNSKDFGVPQNRHRIYIIGHLRGAGTKEIFPLKEGGRTSGGVPVSIAGTVQSDTRMHHGNEVYSPAGICRCLTASDHKDPAKVLLPEIIQAGKLEDTFESLGRVYSAEGISPTLDTCQGGGRQVKILLPGEKPSIRYLTPREYWRAQGFPDWAFDRAKLVNSDSQLYKQAGNSVTVPVIEVIARCLADVEVSA